jgi:hypothetical protein
MKYLILVPLFYFSHFLLYGQDQVFTKRGERYEGKVVFNFNPTGYEEVIIKTEEEKLTFRSYLVDLVIYNEDTLHVLTFSNETKFGLLKSDGKRLAHYRVQDESNYDFDKEILYKKDARESIDVPNIGFKKPVARFLSDCEVVSEQILEGELKAKDIEEIIYRYDNCGSVVPPKQTTPGITSLKTYVDLLSQLITQIETGQEVSPELLSAIEVYRNADSIETLLQELKNNK